MRTGANLRVPLIGAAAGLLNGLIGIGGGIVIVPGMILHRGATPQVAVGTSLATVVVLSSCAFALHVGFSGFALSPVGACSIIVTGMLGTYVGGRILARLTARWMLLLFAAFLLLFSSRLVAQGLGFAFTPAGGAAPPPLWSFPVLGFASGVLSGLFGVGGGALVLLGFAVLFGMPVHQGLPVALAVNVTNALAGSIAHARAGRVLWREVGWMVPTALAGIVAGTALALWLSADVLRIVFGGFFMFMGVRIASKAWRASAP